MALREELLESVAAVERHLPAWDALAVARGRPYCAPGWMLSWLHEVAPAGAALRACVVRDGDELVGIAPFWTLRDGGEGRYGVLAERTAYPIEPLSVEGRDEEVAAAVARLLAAAVPCPQAIDLTGVPAASRWPHLLAESWPDSSGASIARTREEPVPSVSLRHPSMDAWLGTRSRNFRQQLRRGRRRLDEAGASFRLSTASELDRDISSLARLHHARWTSRGGSAALDARVEAMLRLAARELGPERFRLMSIDVEDTCISAHLFVRAGGTRAYWLGGFDEGWSDCRPSIQVLAAAIEDGIECRDDRLELGPGGQHYKYRLSDGEDRVAWLTLTPAAR
ncbi:MAG TPA: GNAT family N-acetyltransferase [Thermoleophilaceae bacterium]|nr:GNAT family N-acetyltransferase [Thermoleophilaceae bacterium]